VREEPEAFVLASQLGAHESLIAAFVLCDTTRDGVIQTSVQATQVLVADGRIQEQREFGNGLAHVPIVVYDLRHREAVQLEVTAMECRVPADLRGRWQVAPEGIDQLIEKSGNPVLEFLRRGRWG